MLCKTTQAATTSGEILSDTITDREGAAEAFAKYLVTVLSSTMVGCLVEQGLMAEGVIKMILQA